MSNFDSEKLIERIEEAKDWLEKAKDEYSKSNPVRGGIILNLAQAEVKHAWELSHHQFVSKSVQRATSKNYIKYWIPVAASIVLFIGLFVGVQAGKKGIAPELISVKDSSGKITGINHIERVDDKAVNENYPSEVLNLNSAVKISEEQSEKAKKEDIQLVANESMNSTKKQAETQPEHKKQEVISVKSSIKPVSQFSFDEEALTKEASHSLRNGK